MEEIDHHLAWNYGKVNSSRICSEYKGRNSIFTYPKLKRVAISRTTL